MRRIRLVLVTLWAAPWTLFGLAVGCVGLATGGRGQRHGRVLEFWGGGVSIFLRTFSLLPSTAAMTFGHTVLARSKADLDWTRTHERVHVGQYERWGPLFGPAYLYHSIRLWLRGRDPYRDNPFEREAFERGQPGGEEGKCLSQIPFCGTAALGCAGAIAQPRAAVPRFGIGTKRGPVTRP